jgi:hypothetical protein
MASQHRVNVIGKFRFQMAKNNHGAMVKDEIEKGNSTSAI